MILDTAPIAAEKRVASDEIQRAGDPASLPLGQNQQDVVTHRRLHLVEEGAGEIGRAPFAAAGILIEAPEGLPMLGLDRIAGQRVDRATESLRLLAFLAQCLALA